MSGLWLQFALRALCIVVAGARLSYYGDIVAARTRLSRSAVGLMLLALATSLPELVSGVSAVDSGFCSARRTWSGHSR